MIKKILLNMRFLNQNYFLVNIQIGKGTTIFAIEIKVLCHLHSLH